MRDVPVVLSLNFGDCEQLTLWLVLNHRLPKEDMKMIHPGLLAIGYIMVALTVISALLCICFVLYYRTKSVLGKMYLLSRESCLLPRC